MTEYPIGLWYLLEKRDATGKYVRWIWKANQDDFSPARVEQMTNAIKPALNILNSQHEYSPCTLSEVYDALEQADAAPLVLHELGDTYMRLKINATGEAHGFVLQYYSM